MTLIELFLEFLLNLKMYHWRTQSYSRHKASDDCFQKLQTLIDQFVETSAGSYGRKALLKSNGKCIIHSLNEKSIVKYVQNFKSILQKMKLRDSDLANIRDEMLTEVNQCLYLFTLD